MKARTFAWRRFTLSDDSKSMGVSPCAALLAAAAEQHMAVRRVGGRAACGMMGQDLHGVAADLLQRVGVVHPARAGELAEALQRPADLMLRIDHVAARLDRKSTRLNSSHIPLSRMPSSA